ncbi:MAG: hypothetical protein ACKO5F_03710, partial [Synechococcus sp.]
MPTVKCPGRTPKAFPLANSDGRHRLKISEVHCLGKAIQSWPGAIVVALYGPCPDGLQRRLTAFRKAGLLVVAVNNNPKSGVTELSA